MDTLAAAVLTTVVITSLLIVESTWAHIMESLNLMYFSYAFRYKKE